MGLFEFFDGVINFVGTVAVLPAMAISDAITSRAMEKYDEDSATVEIDEEWFEVEKD